MELTEEQEATAVAMRQKISHRMAEEDRKAFNADPAMRYRTRMRVLMTTVRRDPLIEANATVILVAMQKAEEEHRAAAGIETTDLENPAKNLSVILDHFRVGVTPAMAKDAMRSFVVRREFSRRLREAAPKTTPVGVISEAEFRVLQSEMAQHHLKTPEPVNAPGG